MTDPRDRIGLRPGASNPDAPTPPEYDDERRRDDESIEAAARGYWIDETAGLRVDWSPYDVREPSRHQVPPRDHYPPDVQGGLQRQRDTHANGSPMALQTVKCAGCGTPGTYYGRIDSLPDQPHCRRCTNKT